MLRFGCFKHLMGIMYDHHILIFGQNSLLLHGGYLELKEPVYPHFVFFLNKTFIKHLVFWGRVYRKEIFLFAIKINFPQAESRNFYFWHSQSLLCGILFVSGSNLDFDKNFKLLSVFENFN